MTAVEHVEHADRTRVRSARARLLAAADELFYAEGVQTVGIDRVIERAGVAKASLYNTFGSKEALVGAYLEGRHAGTAARLTAAVEAQRDPRARLLAVFEAQAEVIATPGFNGCAFTAASADAPPGSLVDRATAKYRRWTRALLTDLAREAGATDPAGLGARLHLVYDGAGVSARLDRDPSVGRTSLAVATALLDAATP